MTALYTDFKLEQGYSPDEIIAKARSLKRVQEPFSTKGYLDLFGRAGFVDVMFLQIPALALTISALVIVVFSLFLLHDVSRIVHGGETNYIMTSPTTSTRALRSRAATGTCPCAARSAWSCRMARRDFVVFRAAAFTIVRSQATSRAESLRAQQADRARA